MIMVPLWAVGLVLVGLLFPVGLGCYWFGWSWRDRFEARRLPPSFRSSRPMTSAEVEKMQESFAQMDRAFETMGEAFDIERGRR